MPDLEPAPALGAVLEVDGDVGPWRFPHLLVQGGVVALDDGDVVGAVLAQPVAVGVLGVGGRRPR
ncbi:hypothetical protein GCM10010420_55060 [Streptomyces glaucosporus]|uniref:Uncharacterized protein n=1 Tax=Streptomyces glaucosporus TaxID=284044 RepID=A0ABP5W5H0_9ACTN